LIFTDLLGFARNIPDGMVLTVKLYVAKIALLDVVNFWNVFLIFNFFFIFKDSLLIFLNVSLISIYVADLSFVDRLGCFGGLGMCR
jgi:hypothetical protein